LQRGGGDTALALDAALRARIESLARAVFGSPEAP
jgi:hypothetical protein